MLGALTRAGSALRRNAPTLTQITTPQLIYSTRSQRAMVLSARGSRSRFELFSGRVNAAVVEWNPHYPRSTEQVGPRRWPTGRYDSVRCSYFPVLYEFVIVIRIPQQDGVEVPFSIVDG